MKKRPTRSSLTDLQLRYGERQAAIRRRLAEFRRVPPSDYFYELVYCLLTPQSSAANAQKAVELLKRRDFANAEFDPAPLLHQKDFYIRFHHTKGKHLVAMKKQYPEILFQLSNGTESAHLREWLVMNAKGFGYKEASHFLRNIGHRGLAILDRHILRNLVRFGALRALPKTLTRKRYLAIEKKFRKLSDNVGIPMDELDLLFWSMETGEILK